MNKDNDYKAAMKKCAKTAYSDLRRGPLTGMGNMRKEKGDDVYWRYRSAIEDLIVHRITCNTVDDDPALFKIESQNSYNRWHKKTCDEMRSISSSEKYCVSSYLNNKFSYGLAQKWLNITLKNMLVAGLWDAKMRKLKKWLHVPVDDYVLKGAKSSKEPYGLNIPKNELPERGTWSSWDDYEKEYIKFQDLVREETTSKGFKCPIDWEFDAWIAF